MSSQILDYPSCEKLNERIEGVNITDSSPFGYTRSSLLVISAFEGKEVVVYDSNENKIRTKINHTIPIIDIIIHNEDIFGVLDNEFFFTQYSISKSSVVQRNRIPLKEQNERVVKVVNLSCQRTTSEFQPSNVVDFLGVLLSYTNFPNIKILRTVEFTPESGSEKVEEISSYQTDTNKIHLVPLPFPPIATFIFSLNPDTNNNPFSEIFRVKGGKKVFKVARFRSMYDRIVKAPMPTQDEGREGNEVMLLCLRNQEIGFHCSCDLFRTICVTDMPKVKKEKKKGMGDEELKKMLAEREFITPCVRMQLLHHVKIDYSLESVGLNFSFFLRRYLVLPRGTGMLGLADVGKGSTVFFWDTTGSVFNTSSLSMMSTSGGEIAHCYILPNGKVLIFEKKESTIVSFDSFDPEMFRKQSFMNTAIGTGIDAGKPVDLKLFDIYGMFKRKMMKKQQLHLSDRRIRTLISRVDPNIFNEPQRLPIPKSSIVNFDLLKIIFENEKGETKELITFKSLFDLYFNFEVIFDGNRTRIAKTKVKRPYSNTNELRVRMKNLKIMYLEPCQSSFFTKILLGHNFVFLPIPLYISYYYLFSTLTLHNDRIYRHHVRTNPKQYPNVRKGQIKNCFYLLLDIICKRISEMEDRKNVLAMFIRSCKLFEDVKKKKKMSQEEEEEEEGDITMMNKQVSFRSRYTKYCFARLYKLSMKSLEAEKNIESVIRELFGRNCVMPKLTSFEQSVSLIDSKDISFENNFWRSMIRTKPLIHDVDELVDEEKKKTTTTTTKEVDQKLITLHLRFLGEEEESVSVEVIPELLIRSSNYFFNLFMLPNPQITVLKKDDELHDQKNEFNYLVSNLASEKMMDKKSDDTPDLKMNIDLFLNTVKYYYNPRRYCRDEKNLKQLIELLIFSVVHDEYDMRLDISSTIQTLSKTVIVTESQRGVVSSSSTTTKKKKKKKKKMKDEEEEEDELEDLTFVNVLKDVSPLLVQSERVTRFLVGFWGRVSNYNNEEIERMIREFSTSSDEVRIDYTELVGLKWGGNEGGGGGMPIQQQQQQKKKKQKSKMKDEDEEEEDEDESEGETEDESGEEEEEGEGESDFEDEKEATTTEPETTTTTTTVPTEEQEEEEEEEVKKMVDEDEEEEEEKQQPEEEKVPVPAPVPVDGFGFQKVESQDNPSDPFSFSFDDFKIGDGSTTTNTTNNNNNNESFFNQSDQTEDFKFVPLVQTPVKKDGEEEEEKDGKKEGGNNWLDFDKPISNDWNFKIE